jgi:hypothetical protein
VFWILADNAHNPFAMNEFALIADFFTDARTFITPPATMKKAIVISGGFK